MGVRGYICDKEICFFLRVGLRGSNPGVPLGQHHFIIIFIISISLSSEYPTRSASGLIEWCRSSSSSSSSSSAAAAAALSSSAAASSSSSLSSSSSSFLFSSSSYFLIIFLSSSSSSASVSSLSTLRGLHQVVRVSWESTQNPLLCVAKNFVALSAYIPQHIPPFSVAFKQWQCPVFSAPTSLSSTLHSSITQNMALWSCVVTTTPSQITQKGSKSDMSLGSLSKAYHHSSLPLFFLLFGFVLGFDLAEPGSLPVGPVGVMAT